MHWAAIVFGWPAAFTAVALSAVGLVIRRPALVWAGAGVGLPFMLYLLGAPRFWFLPAAAAPCHFAAASALARGSARLAWLLFLPTPLLTGYVLAVVVLFAPCRSSMPTFIALLRGINVAGYRMVSMADLRAFLAELGFENARSLLQSGNLVFEARGSSAAMERRLEREAAARLGLETDFIVRDSREWGRVVSRNPFTQMAADDPGHLVVVFLKEAPADTDVEALRAAISGPESIVAEGRELYVTYPGGIGRSRLTGTMIEKALRTRGTARNWNTVLKIAAVIGA